MKRFYTLPEPFHDYPFLLTPYPTKYKRLRKARFKHAIVDSGVEIFAHGASEYPKWFFNRYEFMAQQLTEIYGDRLWVVIPDYPDDYLNNPIPQNVKRTLKNIKRFHKVDGVNWVYPLQSDYLNLQSFHAACHKVMKYSPERVAIGTVCKCRNITFIEKACIMARKHFLESHVHAFGPTLSSLLRILPHIDSWDSCAYFTSRESGKGMCRNQKERKEYFEAYMRRVNEILEEYHSQTRLAVEGDN